MLKVLIVDDDKNLCECLLRLMPWEDMDCSLPLLAYDGLEAWELLQREKIDFIICDLKMPVVEGIELCRRIYEKRWKIDIVFLSAYEDFSIARKALQYGVTDYILKPISRESLDELETIIRNINLKRARKVIGNRFLDEEYTKRIFDAICNRDLAFLHDMFEELNLLEEQEIINVGITLLRVFHDYLVVVKSTTERSVLDARLKKWRSDFIKLWDKDERINYILMLFQNEMVQTDEESEVEYAVRKIKKLACDNYANHECNVAWIANKLHMTSGYVGKIFNKSTGIGLMEYIVDCRMKAACRLLSDENIPVSKIATQVGYVDANYFTKAFRNKIGMSPSEYRKKSNTLEKQGGGSS